MNLVDIKFTGGIAVENFFASADISTLLVDKIDIPVSTIGKLSALQLKIEFNTASRLLVPALNSWLQKYRIPLPQQVAGIFTLSNLFLTYNDGFIFAGATPTFVAPTAAPTLQKAEAVSLLLEQF